MEFYIVFVKNRKKFDKYVKVNKIRNKAIVDIKQQLEEHGISANENGEYKDYFNLIIYTKIIQTFKKNRDIYYIPNLNKICEIDISEILQIKDTLYNNVNFNLLFFYEDFKDNKLVNDSVMHNISIFDAIQIIRDY